MVEINIIKTFEQVNIYFPYFFNLITIGCLDLVLNLCIQPSWVLIFSQVCKKSISKKRLFTQRTCWNKLSGINIAYQLIKEYIYNMKNQLVYFLLMMSFCFTGKSQKSLHMAYVIGVSICAFHGNCTCRWTCGIDVRCVSTNG